jgi:hypothetical protein
LVAALAWTEAIKVVFKEIFGTSEAIDHPLVSFFKLPQKIISIYEFV